MYISIIYQQHGRWKGILKRVATHAALQLRMHANVNTAHRKAYKMLQDAGVAPILQTETQRGYTYNHNEHNSCIPRIKFHYNPDLPARRQSRRRRGHLCRYGRIAMVSGPLHRIPRRFYNYVRQRTGVPKRKLEMGSLLSYTPNRSHMTNYEPPEKDYRRWRRRTVKLSRRPYIASGIWPKGTSHYGA